MNVKHTHLTLKFETLNRKTQTLTLNVEILELWEFLNDFFFFKKYV